MSRALRALALGLLACVLASCAGLTPHDESHGGSARLSLLALGDWGRTPKDGAAPPKQVRVGRALADEDKRVRADAIVFVGDNFYPHGLLAHELELRLRLNLVTPYCRFLRLTERGQSALGDACPEPQSQRYPLPLWAVLGNHDHNSPESPELERSRIPDYVANWELLGLPVETREWRQGVSLVFYDSTVLRDPAGASDLPKLTRALRESAGPWRILVAHHPLEGRGASLPIEAAIAAAGVRAQLQLVGHIHDLRASAPAAPLPALQVVSGGGGGNESRQTVLPGQLFQLASTGFARVDLVGDGDAARLSVRLFAVSEADTVTVVGAWTISREGDVSAETLR